MNYYNEWDKDAAAWLVRLIERGLIPLGHVDTRSISEVSAGDIRGYTQCHFFAGIGGWSYALELAGVASDRPVWTGSCPCQPFSVIGKQTGFADERHLWPEFHRLIAQCRPPVVFGEQVASAVGREWLAGVRTDLEGSGYVVGASDLCAASVGAPHIRQRIFWVGYADDARLEGHARNERSAGGPSSPRSVASPSRPVPWDFGVPIVDRLGNSRRCEPGLSPMAARLPTHMVQLKGYGNAIVPQLAAQFVLSAEEAIHDL